MAEGSSIPSMTPKFYSDHVTIGESSSGSSVMISSSAPENSHHLHHNRVVKFDEFLSWSIDQHNQQQQQLHNHHQSAQSQFHHHHQPHHFNHHQKSNMPSQKTVFFPNNNAAPGSMSNLSSSASLIDGGGVIISSGDGGGGGNSISSGASILSNAYPKLSGARRSTTVTHHMNYQRQQRYTPYHSRWFSNRIVQKSTVGNGNGNPINSTGTTEKIYGNNFIAYNCPTSMDHLSVASTTVGGSMSSSTNNTTATIVTSLNNKSSGSNNSSYDDSGLSSMFHDSDPNNNNLSLMNSSEGGAMNTVAGNGVTSNDNNSLNIGGSAAEEIIGSGSGGGAAGGAGGASAADTTVTLQISNIDTTIDDRALKHFLINELKPISPILSFNYEGLAVAKILLPSQHYAKQVIAYLHRKKIGHKRVTVSYTKDSSTIQPSTLRCQVAGLLKDIPFYKLAMYKFRELFQSRFKTSISLADLYEMQDICVINEISSDEKFISLRPELINSIENKELLGCLQLSVPYCVTHFTDVQRGWAELEIEPLPNVFMSIADVRSMCYRLLKNHKGDIPLASLLYCVKGELGQTIERNDRGVNLEHLISCINGVHITTNKFGIKILRWLVPKTVHANNNKKAAAATAIGGGNIVDSQITLQQPPLPVGLTQQPQQQSQQPQQQPAPPPQQQVLHCRYAKFASNVDPFDQISREIIELVKMSPKSTMKFSRFIPAYHNHFGKQCRVADYGYTKLIELFEALAQVVQIMGGGENRQITLTHSCQIRCFISDIFRILRCQPNKSMLLSELPELFSTNQERKFDITDYGICHMDDIVESLIHCTVISITQISNNQRSGGGSGGDNNANGGSDFLISIPKRRQTLSELMKIGSFATEVVELFRFAPQYQIPFEKFSCSYHYHYGFQLRLNDYGCLKLMDLLETISGVVEIEMLNEDDRKICFSPRTAQRVFAEQIKELIKMMTGSSMTPMRLYTLIFGHKKQFGYQMHPQSLGIGSSWCGIKKLPFIEVKPSTSTESPDNLIIQCHHEDSKFILCSYAACRLLMAQTNNSSYMAIDEFKKSYFLYFSQILNDSTIDAMNYAIEIVNESGKLFIRVTQMMMFLLRIVDILETRTAISLNELRHILNIGVTDCFSYGYPNIATMMNSFPDIFHSSTPTILDTSEISISKQCILIKNCIQDFNQMVEHECNQLSKSLTSSPLTQTTNTITSTNNISASDLNVEFGNHDNSSIDGSFDPTMQNIAPSFRMSQQAQQHFQQQQQQQQLQLQQQQQQYQQQQCQLQNYEMHLQQHDLNNSNSRIMNQSLNSSIISTDEIRSEIYYQPSQSQQQQQQQQQHLPQQQQQPPPQSLTETFTLDQLLLIDLKEKPQHSPTLEEFNNHIKLYQRKPSINYLNESTNMVNESIPTLSSQLFYPPKPDSPNTNIPYWLDPVWRHDLPSSSLLLSASSSTSTTSPSSSTASSSSSILSSSSVLPAADISGATLLKDSPQKLEIQIPELKLFDITPDLSTPAIMNRLYEKNKNMFKFDFF